MDAELITMDRLSRVPDDHPLMVALRDGVETRTTEFKESQPFDALKWKLVKACMAMANLRDGGRILIGCDERDGVPVPSGMSEEDQRSYNQDALMELVNSYARPPVALTLRRISMGEQRFVGIEVEAFRRSPVMCIKDNLNAKPVKKQVLLPAEIYVRTTDRVSTTRVVTPDLLEEMLENAAWKRATEIIARAQAAGLRMPDSDAIQFARERDDFGGLS